MIWRILSILIVAQFLGFFQDEVFDVASFFNGGSGFFDTDDFRYRAGISKVCFIPTENSTILAQFFKICILASSNA